ncbi:MAG: DUF2062 domain-containing protein [Planctomycetes bacterium]|nr:DUF2062 domain-containing protein [Planctomycetota bacterium]
MKISLRTKLLLRLRPMLRFVKTRILHVNDSPERIAKGLAIGVFIAYLPVMGLQMMLAWITASLLKANRMVAVLGVWVSNAATAVFVYYPAYRLGRLILKMRPSKPELNPEQMDHLFDETLSLYRLLTEFHTQAFWKDVTSTAMNIGLEMLVGGVILGFIAAGLAHSVSLRLISYYRQRKQAKKQRRLSSC